MGGDLGRWYLIKFIEKDTQKMYFTNFKDQVFEVKESGPTFHANDLQNCKKKVYHYLQEHRDELPIHKQRNNKQLTAQELRSLETILWNELGAKEDYEKNFGDTPVTRLVRQIVEILSWMIFLL
ncbi:type I restriction enzyme, R subunit [Evansella caseinilytica]|uniref:Type I restriction enzyme, R subunit n=1 Tax=Evansella caseinilytica TaxID=1503961 RepID=A0A1H3R5D7_9BACI|nr:type I restriction enzyme, R subunit [Evansella caseinilytica]